MTKTKREYDLEERTFQFAKRVKVEGRPVLRPKFRRPDLPLRFMREKFFINQKENQILIKVNPKIYPLEAIYGASYVFLDRAYLRLDGDPEKEVKVFLKGKEKLTKEQLVVLAGEFLNELLNHSLRNAISRENKALREYIVTQALLAAERMPTQESLIKPEQEEGPKPDWKKDPLEIAIPWEEKYGKKKKKGRSKC